jgi:hypothetical protein
MMLAIQLVELELRRLRLRSDASAVKMLNGAWNRGLLPNNAVAQLEILERFFKASKPTPSGVYTNGCRERERLQFPVQDRRRYADHLEYR